MCQFVIFLLLIDYNIEYKAFPQVKHYRRRKFPYCLRTPSLPWKAGLKVVLRPLITKQNQLFGEKSSLLER